MKRSDFGKLSLMELGLLGVKVEEMAIFFKFCAEFGFHSQLLELVTL